MELNDGHVSMLLNMGFHLEDVQRALVFARNDLQEAVAILTDDHPTTRYTSLYETPVDTGTSLYGPPALINTSELNTEKSNNVINEEQLEFPLVNLYELESRVYTDTWSIPYKREESLSKCLVAAISYAKKGICESDPNCHRFMSRCMPEAFNKLLTSNVVHRWLGEVQEGIYEMLEMLVQLILIRLQSDPIPLELINLLATVFDSESEFCLKNKDRFSEKSQHWEEVFGDGIFAKRPPHKDPHGWLTDLINLFAELQGFEIVKARLEQNSSDISIMNALFSVFAKCSEFLNPEAVQPYLCEGIVSAVEFAKNLEDFKEKRVGNVCDMLMSLKMISLNLCRDLIPELDRLRAEITLKMLKSNHFNARMNGIKEVTRMIQETKSNRMSRLAMSQEEVTDWIVNKRVLSIALEGSIDKSQYCTHIKDIVDYLGPRLLNEEIAKIWTKQSGENSVVVDNIHNIITAAAAKFSTEQFQYLVSLIEETWKRECSFMREKLIKLIGRIGRECDNQSILLKVLEFLWDISHLPDLKLALLERALLEHLSIINESMSTKEPAKKPYIYKCIEDIKEGRLILPALKHLTEIVKGIGKSNSHKAEKELLQEINADHDIIGLVTESLSKCHSVVTEDCRSSETAHQNYVKTHLEFLQFILSAGCFYFPWNRCRELWKTLVDDPLSTLWDKETCFEWFSKGIKDFEQETQSLIFQRELLTLKTQYLSRAGFECFKCFFEEVNANMNKLKKVNSGIMVDNADLIGLNFLWDVCLSTQDDSIAESAINMLLSVSYVNLAPKFKRNQDLDGLHQKFIDIWYGWLDKVKYFFEKKFGDNHGFDVHQSHKSAALLGIERLLMVVERYVVSVEEFFGGCRSLPPHGATFWGQSFKFRVSCDNTKNEFSILVHRNETVESLKQKIARELKVNSDLLQFNEKMFNKEQKRLYQLDLQDDQTLNVRILSSSVTSISQDPSSFSGRHSMDLEHERMLPGVIMCSGGQIFQTLCQLVAFDHPRITNKARQLLRLVPTDPRILQSFEAIHSQTASAASSDRQDLIRLKVLSSPSKQKNHTDLPEKLLPSFDFISKQILKTKAASLSSGDCNSSPETSASNSAILPPIKESRLPSSSSSCRSTAHDATASTSSSSLAVFDLSPAQTPKEILASLLSPSDTSMFQVLYNLEVLSSKLMPFNEVDTTSLKIAESFCQNFLDAEGLKLVVSIVQKDLPSSEADYETKQACYDICLQLLRFLLCGNVGMDAYLMAPSSSSSSSYINHSVTFGPSCGPASKIVMKMEEEEFSNLISCFMRVAWTAATGKLQVVDQVVNKDSAISVDMRSMSNQCLNSGLSTGSTESGLSSCSEFESPSSRASPNCNVHSTSRDKYIACEALELFVTCLRLKPEFIEVFYKLPCISDFVIEVLVTSPHEGVRIKAMEQFYKLSQMNSSLDRFNNNVVVCDVADDTASETSRTENLPKPRSPHQFILTILTKARLPFWVPSANIRSINYRLLKQSMQYFALLSQLLAKLTSCMQTQLQLDVNKMLDDEVKWLDNFACIENSSHAESHNILLAGHLQIVRTLLICQGVDKRKYGSLLVHDILFKFLFPEAKMILDCSMSPDSENNLSNLTAKCSMSESRIAAYDLLVELATGDVENMRMICKELISVHHATPHSEMANQWEYMPPVDGRNPCGYVGLKNGGATCYMNSLIQQIFMTPGIAEHILGIDDDNISEDSILFQIQQVLGHLLDSKLQYYIPEGFWNIFRLWGTRINIREQQDVLDFFQSLIDQLDEQLNKLGREQIFKKTFQGLYSDQKICHSCKHRFEQEEAFFALNVTVKNATLQDSLDQFVKGEILDGDNAYNCEKCSIKRDTTKRLCVKLLPPVLCIQLKRFDYDWEANRAIKFDDHFKFPLVLDMEPYTAEGMAWREEQLLQVEEGSDSDSQMTPVKFTSEEDCSSDDPAMEIESTEVDSTQKRPLPRNVNTSFCRPSNHVNYELMGVVVHSGQANAGHYYSFIKERRGSYATNSKKGKWFKFNDTTVEEFDMNEANLESECFGGKYRSKASDSSSYQFPEERQRYWNAYLLFYEKVEDTKTPVSAKKSKVSSMAYKTVSEKSVLCRRQDSLKQLTDLVHKGEKRGLFGNKMPTRVQQMVQAENLQFVKNRNIFELQYFNFIQRLTSANLYTTNSGDKSELNELSLKLACNFLFNTYYRTNFKLRIDMIRWESTLIQIINQSEETCRWMIEFLSRDLDLIKSFLLDCPSKEIRSSFGRYLETVMSCFYRYEGSSNADNFDRVIDSLAYFLIKEVSVNFRQSHEYFQVLFKYAKLNYLSFCHLANKNTFMKLIEFLLGPLNLGDQLTSRRWGPLQSKDFGLLHSTLAILIIHSDVFPFRSHGPKSRWSASAVSYSPLMVNESFHSTMTHDMASFIFGDSAARYLHEVVMALREVTSGIEYILDMLCHCSFNNKSFSFNILAKIFFQCVTAPSNELKHIFQALLQMLLLPDEIQHERLIFIMEEVSDEKLHSNKGLLALIRQYHSISDSKRSYHFIKFLVNLSSSCMLAKEYLLTVSSQWEWAVRWLESKMSENCWGVQTNMSNEETISHSFQRTISAQDTLAGATALLTEIDQQEFPDYKMDSSSPSSTSIIKLSRQDDDDGNQATSSMAQSALQESSTSSNFLYELPSGGSLDDLF